MTRERYTVVPPWMDGGPRYHYLSGPNGELGADEVEFVGIEYDDGTYIPVGSSAQIGGSTVFVENVGGSGFHQARITSVTGVTEEPDAQP